MTFPVNLPLKLLKEITDQHMKHEDQAGAVLETAPAGLQELLLSLLDCSWSRYDYARQCVESFPMPYRFQEASRFHPMFIARMKDEGLVIDIKPKEPPPVRQAKQRSGKR